MIEELKIKNFRGIKEGELKLAPLTILLGANNSGKTAILEALFLAPNPFRKVPYVFGRYYSEGEAISYLNVRGYHSAVEAIHSMHETLSSEGYAFLLYNYTAKQAEIGCKVDGDDYLLLFTLGDEHISVSTNKQRGGTMISATIDDKKVETGRIGLMSMPKFEVSIDERKRLFIDNTLLITAKLGKMGYEYLRRNWATLINLGICKKVAEEASELVYDKYRDITIEPFLGEKLAIYGFLEDGRRIRVGDLGEGVQNYIIARILYELEKPKVLLWDDIEAHFNPRILLNISEWFFDMIEDSRQVILTTHSLEAARTIAGLNEEKAKIYLTSLDNGILKAKELMLKEVEEFLEAGIDVRVAGPLLL